MTTFATGHARASGQVMAAWPHETWVDISTVAVVIDSWELTMRDANSAAGWKFLSRAVGHHVIAK